MSLPIVDSGVLLILGNSMEFLLYLQRMHNVMAWNPVYSVLGSSNTLLNFTCLYLVRVLYIYVNIIAYVFFYYNFFVEFWH